MIDRTPAYVKVEHYIRSLIDSGEGRTTPLPAEPELAQRFGVTRMTVRQAFQRLVMSGLVVRYPGRGSFANASVFDEMQVVGTVQPQIAVERSPRSYAKRVLHYDVRKAPAAVADRFGVRAGTLLTYLQQVRSLDGSPLSIDSRYLPASIKPAVSERQITHGYLLSILTSLGFTIGTKHIEIDAHPASAAEARVLKRPFGSPVLERRVFFCDDKGKLVMFGKSTYPADRFTYRVSVRNLQGQPPPHADDEDDLAAP